MNVRLGSGVSKALGIPQDLSSHCWWVKAGKSDHPGTFCIEASDTGDVSSFPSQTASPYNFHVSPV